MMEHYVHGIVQLKTDIAPQQPQDVQRQDAGNLHPANNRIIYNGELFSGGLVGRGEGLVTPNCVKV